MSNNINYGLVIIMAILLILVIRRQMSLKISRTIDENVVIPVTSSKPSSTYGRFGVDTTNANIYYPTMVDSDGENQTLKVKNSMSFNSLNSTLSVPNFSGNLTGNADTASNLKNTNGICNKRGTSCAKILYQNGATSSSLVDDDNVAQDNVLTYDSNYGPMWKPIPSSGSVGSTNIIFNDQTTTFTYTKTPASQSVLKTIITLPTMLSNRKSLPNMTYDATKAKLIVKDTGSYLVNIYIPIRNNGPTFSAGIALQDQTSTLPRNLLSNVSAVAAGTSNVGMPAAWYMSGLVELSAGNILDIVTIWNQAANTLTSYTVTINAKHNTYGQGNYGNNWTGIPGLYQLAPQGSYIEFKKIA